VIIVLVVLVVLLVGVWVAVVLQRVPTPGVEAAVTTESFPGVPEGPLRGADVADLRFDQVLRGYRMSQVDQILDRLAGELADRDSEIARLRGQEHDGHL
jgi:DivIVA domain-containing protein